MRPSLGYGVLEELDENRTGRVAINFQSCSGLSHLNKNLLINCNLNKFHCVPKTIPKYT